MPNPQSKSDVLFAQLRDDILALNLGPDMALRLPSLSERYKVGLTPLREALTRLAADRLVTPEHNKGFRVAALSHTDLLDLENSRTAIEGAMFVASLTHGQDAWEAQVIGAFHHLKQTKTPSVLLDTGELILWTKRHAAFHDALISAADTHWMRRFRDQLGAQLGRYHRFIQLGLRDLATTHPKIATKAAQIFANTQSLAPHQALYEAALARDQMAATTALETHANLSIAAFEHLTSIIPSGTPVAAVLGKSEALA